MNLHIFYILQGKYKLKINFNDVDDLFFRVVNNHKTLEYIFPKEDDILSSEQVDKIKNLDWVGFKSTLEQYFHTDILICIDNLHNWLIRIFISENSDGKDSLQIEANSKTYIFELNQNSITKIRDDKCLHWEEHNRGTLNIPSFDITLCNGNTEHITL